MPRHSIPAALLAVTTLALLPLASHAGEAARPPQVDGQALALKRGEYLVKFAGCGDCHTPHRMGANGPEPDPARAFSGHPQGLRLPAAPQPGAEWNWSGAASLTAFSGPWGISYASNLTPDVETGIGTWREEDFIRAMQTGKHLGVGRPIMPPMPWRAAGSLAPADLSAVFAYLRSLPAVKNRVPEYQPPLAGR